MKVRSVIAFAACALSLATFGFHIQIGASGWSRRSQQWISDTKEVGGTPEVLTGLYNIPLGLQSTTYAGGGTGSDYCYVQFLRGGGLTLRASTINPQYDERYGAKSFTAAECVQLGTFGYVAFGAWDNGVITIKGDPYSSIMNDTENAITVNDVTIQSGEFGLVPFPIYLQMAQIEGVKFYSLENGTELTPATFGTGANATTYKDGGYRLSWTGGIRIWDGTRKVEMPDEPLVYGDMVPANEDSILHSTNDAPIYAMGVDMTTNIMLQTWWDFVQSEWGSPIAYINDEMVCGGHSTSHIIAYNVGTAGAKVYGNKFVMYFTMSQTPESGHSGGSLTMRAWDANIANYADAPADHRAESTSGRFRVKIDIATGTWKVEAL